MAWSGVIAHGAGCRCWVNQAKSRFPSLFVLPQVPLCRVNQAKIISLIGLEVAALRTLAGAPPRGALSAPFFSADLQPKVVSNRKV
jgi:hypothetical protein